MLFLMMEDLKNHINDIIYKTSVVVKKHYDFWRRGTDRIWFSIKLLIIPLL